MNKNQQKRTITLCMILIGALALVTTPEWLRAARDFVGQSTGHKNTAATPKAGSGGGNRLS